MARTLEHTVLKSEEYRVGDTIRVYVKQEFRLNSGVLSPTRSATVLAIKDSSTLIISAGDL